MNIIRLSRVSTPALLLVVSTVLAADIREITEVEQGVLTIRHARSMRNFMHWFSHESVHITMPVLKSLQAGGASDVRTKGRFSGDELEIVAYGASDIAIDVAVDRLDITTSGGSDLALTGSARLITAKTSGGSDLHASRFQAHEAELTAAGGSDIDITVLDRLTVNASGGSDVRYRGDPHDKVIHASGGADVVPR